MICWLLSDCDDLVLVLERTIWRFGNKNTNLLMLGIKYKSITFLLMFIILVIGGNFYMQERFGLI